MIRDRNQRKQLWLNLRQSASRRPSAPCRRLYLGGNSATIHCDGRLGHCSCTSAPRHQRVTSHAATSWWTADGTGKQRRAKGACYQGYCVVGLLLVTASMRSCGRWLARLVARAMLV